MRQKIWPKPPKLDGPASSTPKIKWLAYTYAEK